MGAIRLGIVLGIALVSASPLLAEAPPQPPPCTGAGFDGFDFWLGEWDVSNAGADEVIAHSRIERLYAGCAVRENWLPLDDSDTGGSLNNYNPLTGTWHQSWIGSQPGRIEFDGGTLADGSMLMSGARVGAKGDGNLLRITWSVTGKDTVRQHGEYSADRGLTWQDRYDLIYTRRIAPIGG